MKLKNEQLWDSYVEKNKDPYGGCCIRIAQKIMEKLDENKPFDASNLISEVDDEGITGFMAGAIASMVSQCHERGDEFRKSWNKDYGVKSESGTVNPAIITIKTN